MSDEVLRSKVKDLLEKMERVFKTEWRKTKLNLDHEMIEHFIDPKGTFFEPEGPNTQIPWSSRDELLISFRNLLEEFDGESTPANLEKTSLHEVKSRTDAVIAAAAADTEEPSKNTTAIPTPNTNNGIPKPKTSSHAIPAPNKDAQWPGAITAPIPVKPGAASGFHNPFAAAVEKKDPPKGPAAMVAPGEAKKVAQDPAALRAIAAKEKFSHLLKGVESEVIRDFILAEGTNSGTGKPTIIIYTLELVWQEFAFPYEEGKRILNKYPQRDAELIEFMKSAGHTS